MFWETDDRLAGNELVVPSTKILHDLVLVENLSVSVAKLYW